MCMWCCRDRYSEFIQPHSNWYNPCDCCILWVQNPEDVEEVVGGCPSLGRGFPSSGGCPSSGRGCPSVNNIIKRQADIFIRKIFQVCALVLSRIVGWDRWNNQSMSQGTVEKLFLINISACLLFRITRAAQSITSAYFKACSVHLQAALWNCTIKFRHILPRNKITTVPRLKEYIKYVFLSQLSVKEPGHKLEKFFE